MVEAMKSYIQSVFIMRLHIVKSYKLADILMLDKYAKILILYSYNIS